MVAKISATCRVCAPADRPNKTTQPRPANASSEFCDVSNIDSWPIAPVDGRRLNGCNRGHCCHWQGDGSTAAGGRLPTVADRPQVVVRLRNLSSEKRPSADGELRIRSHSWARRVVRANASEFYPASAKRLHERHTYNEREPDVPNGESRCHERCEAIVLLLAEVA